LVFGEAVRGNTLVLVEEVVDGGWDFADQVLTLGVRLLAAAAAVGASAPSAPSASAVTGLGWRR
jgi:hypothetical protein